MFRYIAIAWNAVDLRSVTACELITRRIQSAIPEMLVVCHAEGLRVFATGMRSGSSESYPLVGGNGVVLGKLFRRTEAEYGVPTAVVLDETQSAAINRTSGRHLVDQYWGRYVALVHGGESGHTWVLRDPSGGIPCYMTQFDGVTVLFSWMEDCCALGLWRFALNWDYLRALATEFPLQGRATGLQDVIEVQMGECIVLHPDIPTARAQYWNPVEIARRDVIRDFDEAARLARQTVQGCISAWAASYSRIVLMLSGGLDSSIVLACLASAPSRPEIRCVNFYDTIESGDERRYARLAAGRAQRDLTEVQFDPTAVPAQRILAFARMACPTPWAEAFYAPVTAHDLAKQWGAPAVFDGNFGDDLFFYYADRTLRLADYMHDRGLWGRELLRIAVGSAAQERCSLGSTLLDGVRKGLLRPRCQPVQHYGKHRWFVTQETRRAAGAYEAFCPAYLGHRPRIAPGKLQQILGMSFAPLFYSPMMRPNDPEQIPVLTSQPVRELFLRIPTYVLSAAGEPRAVAKRAFMRDVPAEIRARHIKGVVGNFLSRYLAHNDQFARELLLDGHLVKNGLLDRRRLEEFFAARKYGNLRRSAEIVLYHLSLEAWAQGWTDPGRMRAAA